MGFLLDFAKVSQEMYQLFDEIRMAWDVREDIEETKDEYLLRANIPDVKREDIHLSLLNNGLLLVRVPTVPEYGERSYWSIPIPTEIPMVSDMSKAKAEFKHGCLTVSFKKMAYARGKVNGKMHETKIVVG